MAHAITQKRSTYKRQKGFTCYSSVNMHILSRQTGRSKETEMQRIQLGKTLPAWQGKRESRSARERACSLQGKVTAPCHWVFQSSEKNGFCMLLKSKHPLEWSLRRGPYSFLSFSSSLEPTAAAQHMPGDPHVQAGPREVSVSTEAEESTSKVQTMRSKCLQAQHAIPASSQGA